MSIGEHIKKQREENNMSQDELADKLFTCRESVSRMERDLKTNYSESLVKRLCAALDTSPNKLFDFWQKKKGRRKDG